MLEKTRSFFRTILIVANLCVIVAYLLVCVLPYANTGKHWYFAFPGLVFPLVLFTLICFIILWAVLRSRWFWISLIVMCAGTQQILSVLSFRLPQEFSYEKPPATLRVMEWNVEAWEHTQEMMEVVKAQNADILCFEEYADIRKLEDPHSTTSVIMKMGYPYYLFAKTKDLYSDEIRGVVIFSKYPILDSSVVSYGAHTQAEHLISIDIRPADKTFRIFTTHLQSVRFGPSDYGSLSRMKRARDPGYRDSRTIVSKLKTGYEQRYLQAQIVKQKIAESPYPAIITGDFNDVPNSNTYFTIKGNMQDAFLKKGYWIGRTFRFISPTLRIDYILADKKFKVDQFKVIHVPYSDHFPIVADLQY
ncbi:MAG: endonuclease/exonuclease/phosphatase family protein [Ginsengibacter sp.]